MTRFSESEIKEASAAFTRIAVVGKNFLEAMKYKDGTPSDAVQLFDSVVAQAEKNGIDPAFYVPSALSSLMEKFSDSPLAKKQLLDSISTGIQEYRSRHGAMPSTGIVGAALEAAKSIYCDLTPDKTMGLFDSALARNPNSETQSFYDSVTSQSSTHVADVPALAMVTITMLIANASPLTAYLPNPKGTASLPLLYVRHTAGRDYGSTKKGDFLDGVKAASQYFDSIHKFALTSADNITYTVTTKRQRDEDNKPIGNERLPIVVGANRAYLNGILVGTDAFHTGKKNGAGSKFEPVEGVEVVVGADKFKLVSGVHDANTDTITLVFDKALPPEAKVHVSTAADYERVDNAGKTILIAPNTDVDLDYATVHAYGIRAIYTATIDALMQMQNELGVDMRSAFVAIVIAKLMLEQNTRLLIEAAERADGLGLSREVDLTRGSDMTAAFNKTSDIGAEIFPAIEDGKRRMVERTGHRPNGHDIYMTGALGTLMTVLADDTHFIPSALSFGMPNEIVRIGSKGADNYYYVPTTTGIVKEGEVDIAGKKSVFSEMLIIGRNNEAAKSVFVGHVCVPVITGDVRSEEFKQGVTYFSKVAAQMNDIGRYADQVFKLKVLNLPKSLTVSPSP
ncbi:hypothetical protein DJ533_00200 (plasmid) [Acinetobacter defluvii]|uniref:Uncharacterized protein n=1 Tax=Acinetobacter defluvii TaxID=1871111 RepID=A0A2S2F895_9GAMM|nr:hypothetical protein [Acinetobacter defluvii]AWL27140.1 hypothetical protein DJ533_00200 [Acinetobacter defluvii]